VISHPVRICLSLLAVFGAAGLARAQNAEPKVIESGWGVGLPGAAASKPGVVWTGPYAGANFVAGASGFSLADSNGGSLRGVGSTGYGLGLTLGYDYQLAQGFVTGVAADINGAGGKARYGDAISASAGALSQSSAWALRGRAGVTVGAETLLYGTAGYSESVASLGYVANGRSLGATVASPGVVFGGGVETEAANEIFLRGEYLHGRYASRSYLDGALGVSPWSDDFRVALIYRPQYLSGGAQAPTLTPGKIDWSGFYALALVGPQSTKTRIVVDGAAEANGLLADGVGAAVAAGYGQQTGDLYAGLEMELGDANSVAKFSQQGAVAELASKWEWATRARAGLAVTPNTMIYVAGGWSLAGGAAELDLGPVAQRASFRLSGPQVGLGVETMFSEHLGGRLEYLETFYAPLAGGAVSPNASLARAGLLYHF